MKKVFFIALCFVGIVFQSNGQAGIRLGIKGGPNFANLDTETNLDSRTGIHAGAFATIKISKIAIQPEIIYSSQGANVDVDGLGDLRSSFNYINIPVMFKLYLIGGLNLQVGPQFGFLTSAKQDGVSIDPLNGNLSVDEDVDVKDFYKSSDFSLGLGAGFDLPFGLTLDGRYNLGLSDIDDDEGLDATSNQVFQISVGYRLISLGK